MEFYLLSYLNFTDSNQIAKNVKRKFLPVKVCFLLIIVRSDKCQYIFMTQSTTVHYNLQSIYNYNLNRVLLTFKRDNFYDPYVVTSSCSQQVCCYCLQFIPSFTFYFITVFLLSFSSSNSLDQDDIHIGMLPVCLSFK